MLTTAQAAAKLGLSRAHVADLCARGELRAERHGLRAWAIPAAAITEYCNRSAARAAERQGQVGRPRRVTAG